MHSPVLYILHLLVAAFFCDAETPSQSLHIKLQRLNIDYDHVITSGCSHAGDFAHQFHVAFSQHVTGACVFSGQPYRCAVTKFQYSAEVEQTQSSSVPYCDGCHENKTLIYDQCKNHPQFVDVGLLPDYIRRACDPKNLECISDPANLFSDRVFLFQPSKDRCYLDGAVANTHALYAQLVEDPENYLNYVDDQPFPHLLPTNSTPYFNETEPAGYDGPGECLRHVFDDPNMLAAEDIDMRNLFVFDQTEFFTENEEDPNQNTNGTGANDFGAVYIPKSCRAGGTTKCKLVIGANKCGGDNPGFGDGETAFAKYCELNNIVYLQPCVGGYFDEERFPNAAEVKRGLLDVYGQLGGDYALQSAPHMRFIGKIVKRVLYGE